MKKGFRDINTMRFRETHINKRSKKKNIHKDNGKTDEVKNKTMCDDKKPIPHEKTEMMKV